MNEIFLAVLFFCIFIGIPFIPTVAHWFDFEARPLFGTIWNVGAAFFVTYIFNFDSYFSLTGIASPAIFTFCSIALFILFSHYWQQYGRPVLSEQVKKQSVTTFYEFPPVYAFVKTLEIYLQALLTIVIISNLYAITDFSVTKTMCIFGALFIVLHFYIAMELYSREWLWWVLGASLFVGTAPVLVVIYVPAALLWVFGMHLLSYLLFLVLLRSSVLAQCSNQ